MICRIIAIIRSLLYDITMRLIKEPSCSRCLRLQGEKRKLDQGCLKRGVTFKRECPGKRLVEQAQSELLNHYVVITTMSQWLSKVTCEGPYGHQISGLDNYLEEF